MSKMQRTKGKAGELEVVGIARGAGFFANRTGDAQQHQGDVEGIPGHHVQVKRAEALRIPEWLRELDAACPNETIPLLAFRQSREPWRAIVPLRYYLDLVPGIPDISADWPPVKERTPDG